MPTTTTMTLVLQQLPSIHEQQAQPSFPWVGGNCANDCLNPSSPVPFPPRFSAAAWRIWDGMDWWATGIAVALIDWLLMGAWLLRLLLAPLSAAVMAIEGWIGDLPSQSGLNLSFSFPVSDKIFLHVVDPTELLLLLIIIIFHNPLQIDMAFPSCSSTAATSSLLLLCFFWIFDELVFGSLVV